jgi:hypothetical protein
MHSFLVITGCTFSSNVAGTGVVGDGGGVFNSSSSAILTNCIFSNNYAFKYVGGLLN